MDELSTGVGVVPVALGGVAGVLDSLFAAGVGVRRQLGGDQNHARMHAVGDGRAHLIVGLDALENGFVWLAKRNTGLVVVGDGVPRQTLAAFVGTDQHEDMAAEWR